jgi:hypothetical protein
MSTGQSIKVRGIVPIKVRGIVPRYAIMLKREIIKTVLFFQTQAARLN